MCHLTFDRRIIQLISRLAYILYFAIMMHLSFSYVYEKRAYSTKTAIILDSRGGITWGGKSIVECNVFWMLDHIMLGCSGATGILQQKPRAWHLVGCRQCTIHCYAVIQSLFLNT